MNLANLKMTISTIGVAVLVIGVAVMATKTAASAPAPNGDETIVHYAPGETIDLPAEQAPSPEEMEIFNRRSEESFRQLVKENPDVEMHDLNAPSDSEFSDSAELNG